MPLLNARVAITVLFFWAAALASLRLMLVSQAASLRSKQRSVRTRGLPGQASPTLSNGVRFIAASGVLFEQVHDQAATTSRP